MENIIKCPLFKGISSEEVNKIIGEKFGIRKFEQGRTIIKQGDEYSTLLIVIDGEVSGEMTDLSGKNVIIENIPAPNVLAPAIIFAENNRIPVNVIALTQVTILPISREDFTHMLQRNIKLLNNFLQLISDRSRFLTDKVRLLRFGTIKSKIAGYLIEIYSKKDNLRFEIKHSQQELADMFGVTRPALAKTIGQMTDEGLILSNKKEFKILNLNELYRIYRENA